MGLPLMGGGIYFCVTACSLAGVQLTEGLDMMV